MQIQEGKESYYASWKGKQTAPTRQLCFSAAEAFALEMEPLIYAAEDAWAALENYSARALFTINDRFGDISSAQDSLFFDILNSIWVYGPLYLDFRRASVR